MKAIISLTLVSLFTLTAYANSEKISIAEVKRSIADNYQVDVQELADNASCEAIDQFLAKHAIEMIGANEQILSAKEGIDCN